MTDEEFVTAYIEHAKEGTIATADEWVATLFDDGVVPEDFKVRLAAQVVAALQEADLVPNEVTPVTTADIDVEASVSPSEACGVDVATDLPVQAEDAVEAPVEA